MKTAGITYSIKDLEKISGVKAHTIRIWEQRYNILEPKRTDTNIRYYDGEDLKRLLNICLLNDNGKKISQIAKMSTEEMYDEVNSFWDCCDQSESQVNALTLSMMELDEPRFEKIINQNILQLGLEQTITKIIYPFFEKVGFLWQTCSINPAQEHFISNLIRQKVIVAIDGQASNPEPGAGKYLLYLPEGEYHELGLLISSYILKSRGQKVIYLGQSLPFEDLLNVHGTYKADYIITLITTMRDKKELLKYFKKLSSTFPQSQVLISGNPIVRSLKSDLPERCSILEHVDSLVQFVEARRNASQN